MKNFVDAFLDKGLSPLERIKKVWYIIFFLRYWHRWLSLHKKFNVKENFITSNAFSGIELNGHALVSLVILMRDKIPNGNELFCPWLLGSQPCEQTFRAARSMTGTFSTIINFSMHALLQRLHRLQIQLQLESEMKETGIQYPRVINHVKKTGFSSDTKLSNLMDISDKEIFDTVERAKREAQYALEDLGIYVKDKDGKWEDLTLKVFNNKDDDKDDDDKDDDEDDDDKDDDKDDEDDDDKDDDKDDEDDNDKDDDKDDEDDNDKDDDKDDEDDEGDTADKEEGGNEQDLEFMSKEELQKDVLNLQKAGLAESQLSKSLQNKKMKRSSSSTISLYSAENMENCFEVSS